MGAFKDKDEEQGPTSIFVIVDYPGTAWATPVPPSYAKAKKMTKPL